jgi:hypothetical protein
MPKSKVCTVLSVLTRVLREITTLALREEITNLSLFSMPSRHSSLRGRYSLPILPELPITETIDEVIVYHSNGLHVGIHDRRTNETESAMLEILSERIGFERSCRDLSHDLPAV